MTASPARDPRLQGRVEGDEVGAVSAVGESGHDPRLGGIRIGQVADAPPCQAPLLRERRRLGSGLPHSRFRLRRQGAEVVAEPDGRRPVDEAEADAQMGGDPVAVEVIGAHGDRNEVLQSSPAGAFAQMRGEDLGRGRPDTA